MAPVALGTSAAASAAACAAAAAAAAVVASVAGSAAASFDAASSAAASSGAASSDAFVACVAFAAFAESAAHTNRAAQAFENHHTLPESQTVNTTRPVTKNDEKQECEAPMEQGKRTAVLSKEGSLQRRLSKAPQKQDRLTNCVSWANTLAARCIAIGAIGAGTSLDGVRAQLYIDLSLYL